jgi:hypothetical protein
MTRILLAAAAFGAAIIAATAPAAASSHMDAPAITLDDAANTTDVYAFVTRDEFGRDYLTTALAVYPFEEPGIGPNAYQFADDVRYAIHVALDDGVARGTPAVSFEFDFDTAFVNRRTILQSYLGVLAAPAQGQFTANQNRRQTYVIRRIDQATGRATIIGNGQRDGLIVPPNNQGLVTPLYNKANNGDNPAKDGVAREADLDPYTKSAVARLRNGFVAFAGQRDDGFYADIQSIFDLDFSFGAATRTPAKPFDSQGGMNVHTIVLSIPLDQLVARGAPTPKLAGVFATTSRKRTNGGERWNTPETPRSSAIYDQVGRQGNPLFVEALLPIRDKDRYNQTSPTEDFAFTPSVDNPELSRVLGVRPIIDLRTIFTPDVIRVDLTTGPARLAGQTGFNRLSVFGGDVLKSQFQDPFGNGGFIPGGWPNGRRFGDDVVDIAVIALGAGGPLGTDFSGADVDRVKDNDITYNIAFPYAATPLNGRNRPDGVRVQP